MILGKQAIDDDSNQTGQMLAALLDWPQATSRRRSRSPATRRRSSARSTAGSRRSKSRCRVVVTTDLRLNEPRYATLPNIMKAKKKPLETVKPDALGVDVAPRLTTLKVVEPPKRKGGGTVADVAELVDKLRNEAKVIS